MTNEIILQVDGYPPAKNESLSMLGANHPHRARVIALLEGAQAEATKSGFEPFSKEPIGLELVLQASPDDRNLGDGTNYLGGVADVLQNKSHLSNSLEHLGALHEVDLYDNDEFLRQIRYWLEPSEHSHYVVRVWGLT